MTDNSAPCDETSKREAVSSAALTHAHIRVRGEETA